MTNPLLDLNARMVIAHRGNRARHPENTMPAFRDAMNLGVDGIEFDVRVTRDGVAVVMHDPTLDRTTNGHGRVSQYSLSEIRTLDAGSRFPGRPSERHEIPLLEEILDAFREIPMVIEVKETAAVELTVRVVRKFDAADRVLIGSSVAGVMGTVRGTGLPACASMGEALRLIPTALTGGTPSRLPYDVLSLTPSFRGLPIPVLSMAAAARRAGVPTQVWTVNEPALAARLWGGGVAAILTDDPAALLGVRPR